MVKGSTLAGKSALVGIIMGSSSDWETLEHAAKVLEELGVPHETRVVSAHRTPDLLFEYAASAEKRGIEVIIAGAGGAAHLPGMTASKTVLPVLGVPVESKTLKGLDSLLSIAQMPGGVPVGTMAIGKAGAINAALLAAATATRPALGTVNEWAFAVREALATEEAGRADEPFLDFFIRPNIQRAGSGIAMNAARHPHIRKPKIAIRRFRD